MVLDLLTRNVVFWVQVPARTTKKESVQAAVGHVLVNKQLLSLQAYSNERGKILVLQLGSEHQFIFQLVESL
jgi:hypothetical protein